MKKTPSTLTTKFMLLLALIALTMAGYWLTRSTSSVDPSLRLDALTTTDNDALQQRINNKLFGDEIIDAPGMGAELDATNDASAMQAKLAGLTKNVTTQQLPSAEQLQLFYALNKKRYRNASTFWLTVITFTTANHGGQVFQQAQRALDAGGDPEGDLIDRDAAISSTQLAARHGQSFVESLMTVTEQSTSLPCWYGPISSSQGAHLVCVNKVVWGTYPHLEEVENQLINDWRFSVSQEALPSG